MSTHTAYITDEWLPFSRKFLAELQWQDGDEIELEIVGDCVILRNPMTLPRKVPKAPK